MRIVQYLWFHFIMAATAWLPDLRPLMRVRGLLLRPSFKTCGRNLQVARRVTINFSNRLEIGRVGRNHAGGRSPTGSLRGGRLR
jgi:hypothetical protein